MYCKLQHGIKSEEYLQEKEVRQVIASTIQIKVEFVFICVRDNDFTPVSTILPLYIAVVLMVWYI
jgi:hypothetical protein